jgi:hypothetical protein
MAYTATLVKHLTAGPDRGVIFNVTADANSGSVATPLGFIEAISWGPVSMATGTNGYPKFRPNLSAASAAANGSIMCSSCANGDNFFLVVWGRS